MYEERRVESCGTRASARERSGGGSLFGEGARVPCDLVIRVHKLTVPMSLYVCIRTYGVQLNNYHYLAIDTCTGRALGYGPPAAA